MEAGVLYVDDEENNLNSFKALFRRDFAVYTALSGAEGRKVFERHEIGVVITDQRMPGMSGIEFLESIIPVFPDTVRILMTGFSDMNAVIDAINRGQVYKYLVKPWHNEDLRLHIQNALELYNLRKDNKILTRKLQMAQIQIDVLTQSKN